MTSNPLVGTWKLLSVEDRHPDGTVSYPYGERPAGLLFYDSNGSMAVQIMRRDRPNLSSADLQDIREDELKSALDAFTAFFGSYEIDKEKALVVHRVEGHLFPNSVGKELKRTFELSGERLILKPSATRSVIWERVS